MRRLLPFVFLCPGGAWASCEALLAAQRLIGSGVDQRILIDEDLTKLVDGENLANPLSAKSLDSRSSLFAKALDHVFASLSSEQRSELKSFVAQRLTADRRTQNESAEARRTNRLVIGLKEKEFESGHTLGEHPVVKMSDGRVILLSGGPSNHFVMWENGRRSWGIGGGNVLIPVELRGGKLGVVAGRAHNQLELMELDGGVLKTIRKLPIRSSNTMLSATHPGIDLNGRFYLVREFGNDHLLQPEIFQWIEYLEDEGDDRYTRAPQGRSYAQIDLRGEQAFAWLAPSIKEERILASAKFESPEHQRDMVAAITIDEKDKEYLYVTDRERTKVARIPYPSGMFTPNLSLYRTRHGKSFAALSASEWEEEDTQIYSIDEESLIATIPYAGKVIKFAELTDGRLLMLALSDTSLSIFEPLTSAQPLHSIRLPSPIVAKSNLHVLSYADGSVDVAVNLKKGVYIFGVAGDVP